MVGQGEEFEPELEDLRIRILSDGVEDELILEGEKSKIALFGSLEQGDKGNIVSCSMTEARFGINEEFYQRLFPYVDWPKSPEAPQRSARTEEEERLELLRDYAGWAAGGEVRASFVHVNQPKGE